jgi:hypothetical protein
MELIHAFHCLDRCSPALPHISVRLILHALHMLLHLLFLHNSIKILPDLQVILVLELMQINLPKTQIKGILTICELERLLLNQFSLVLNTLLQFIKVINPLLYYSVDINLLNYIRLSLHYVLSAMQYCMLVLLLRQVLNRFHRSAALDHKLIELKLYSLALYYFFFNGVLADQSVNVNGFLLSNSVGAVHRLQINLWVEVRVVDNNVVCRHEVDPEATSTSAN